MFLPMEKSQAILRYELLSGEELDRFSLNVLCQNTPAGVFVPGRETVEGRMHLLFPVAGTIPLRAALRQYGNEMDPETLLSDILTVKSLLTQYMIPDDCLVLRPEYTFWHPEQKKVVLICLPTSGAKDLSLPWEDYALLVRAIWQEETGRNTVEMESANVLPTEKDPYEGLTFREKMKAFWRGLE